MARTVQLLPAKMSSLPMLDGVSVPAGDAGAAGLVAMAGCRDRVSREDDEEFLLRAFRSFASTAASLERSYGLLRAEVARLHRDLEQSRAGLERSLEENRRMRDHLGRILERLPCGVLVVTGTGEISRANPEARRLLQWNSAGCAPSLERLPAEVKQLLDRAQSTAAEQESCLPDGAGGTCWLAVRHAAVEEATAASSIYILRDVSEAKFLALQRDRQERERALAVMSATLAHEIRNPLASLELFAGLLAEASLPRECQPWVEHVQAGLRSLAATVNNVLHFHGLPALQRAPTDLGALLDWAASFLAPMARRARVELSVRNQLRGVMLAADRHRLEQVLLNLLLNALHAMPGGGWVELSGRICDGSEPAAVLCVRDTGPGIQAELVTKIFEPGFSARPGSPGLGLAVCRKIVEQHGGTIGAAGRPGAGASFTLHFPLAPQEREQGGMR